MLFPTASRNCFLQLIFIFAFFFVGRSKDAIDSSDRHLKDIIETLKVRVHVLSSSFLSLPPLILQNDKRYLVLECIEEERQFILFEYINELHAKGPPPPPTATHPSERLRK